MHLPKGDSSDEAAKQMQTAALAWEPLWKATLSGLEAEHHVALKFAMALDKLGAAAEALVAKRRAAGRPGSHPRLSSG